MPQRATTIWGNYKNNHKATDVRKGQAPAAEEDSAACFINEPTPADTFWDPKPTLSINGFISHEFNDRSRKTSRWKVKKTKGRPISDATDVKGDVVCRSGDTDGVSVTGTKPQALSNHKLPPVHKKLKNKLKHKKNVHTASQDSSTLAQEEEDWDSEIQEVTIPDWEKKHFGVAAYGPEDLLHFSMRDLMLKPQDLLSNTVGYRPESHHPRSIPWFYYPRSSEPGQFADSQEE